MKSPELQFENQTELKEPWNFKSWRQEVVNPEAIPFEYIALVDSVIELVNTEKTLGEIDKREENIREIEKEANKIYGTNSSIGPKRTRFSAMVDVAHNSGLLSNEESRKLHMLVTNKILG